MSITEESLGQMFSFVERLVRDAGVTICQALDKDKKVETKVKVPMRIVQNARKYTFGVFFKFQVQHH